MCPQVTVAGTSALQCRCMGGTGWRREGKGFTGQQATCLVQVKDFHLGRKEQRLWNVALNPFGGFINFRETQLLPLLDGLTVQLAEKLCKLEILYR